jgi:exopolysaccharide biosynthesis polyprenyl glycosylphosphotransferase
LPDGVAELNEPPRLVGREGLRVVGGDVPSLLEVSADTAAVSGPAANAALPAWPRGTRRRTRSRPLATRSVIAVVDLTAILLSLLIAIRGRFPVAPMDIALFIVAYPVAVLSLLTRPVASWDDGSAIEEVRKVVAAVAIPALALIGARDVVSDTVDVQIGLRLAICSLTLLLFGRFVLRYVSGSTRLATREVLIVGAGKVGAQLALGLTEAPQLGLRPVGFLDYGSTARIELTGLRRARSKEEEPAFLNAVRPENGSATVESLPLLGTPESLAQALAQTGAECVAFAFTADGDDRLMPLVEQCEQLGVTALVIPRLFEAAGWRMQVRPVGSLPLVEYCPVGPRDVRFAIKHALDRIVSALLLAALAPVFLVIAASVKATSSGPVFFRQGRVGRDGREFEMFKFRSMREGTTPTTFVPAEGCAPGGVEDVDRRTRVGRWLRRTSLDELPQLINVLRGEMSLIGPRPERPEYVRRFAVELRRYNRRHRVKSGITGLAQVSGLRGQTSIVERAEYDNFYVQNWSFWLDLKIALMTIKTVLSCQGE